jgi:hypothetical protein
MDIRKWHIKQAELHIKIACENAKYPACAKSWLMGAAYHFEQANQPLQAAACRKAAK